MQAARIHCVFASLAEQWSSAFHQSAHPTPLLETQTRTHPTCFHSCDTVNNPVFMKAARNLWLHISACHFFSRTMVKIKAGKLWNQLHQEGVENYFWLLVKFKRLKRHLKWQKIFRRGTPIPSLTTQSVPHFEPDQKLECTGLDHVRNRKEMIKNKVKIGAVWNLWTAFVTTPL